MSTTTAPHASAPQQPTQPSRGSGQDFGASRVGTKGDLIVDWITTTDHKKIGYLYLITSFI
jgi:cytochrome c oxidase subunit 1